MTVVAVTDRSENAPARRRRGGLVALLCAHSLSALGSTMTIVAVPWLVLETTGSIARTGTVVTVYAVGAGVAGFLSGPFIDRWGFKLAGIAAYGGTSAAMAAIAVLYTSGALNFLALLALVLVAAAVTAPGAVALSGLVPSLARAAGTPLERANSSFRGITNITQLTGPALGGLAALVIGAHNVLLLDAAAGALAALLVGLVVRDPDRRDRAPASGPVLPAERGSYVRQLQDGVRTIRAHRLLAALTMTRACYSLLDAGLSGIVLVSIAYLWFGDPASFGAMLTAFGVGALVGTVLFGAIGHRLPRRPLYVAIAVVIGLPLVAVAFAPTLALALAALAVIGVIAAPTGPLTATTLQQTVPRAVYGRVMTTIRVISAAAGPLGVALVAGAVAAFGLRPTILGLTVGYLLIGLTIWRAGVFHELDTVRREAADAALRNQKDLL